VANAEQTPPPPDNAASTIHSIRVKPAVTLSISPSLMTWAFTAGAAVFWSCVASPAIATLEQVAAMIAATNTDFMGVFLAVIAS
jgi:hypothetical protein